MPIVVKLPTCDMFDELNDTFVTYKQATVVLEHSLLSMSKWESRECRPFMSKDKKTPEDVFSYILDMIIGKPPPEFADRLTQTDIDTISEYIQHKATATWFSETSDTASNQQVITSELIYYWMVANNVPFSCEKWHLNRLLTLLRICGEKNKPQEKLSFSEVAARNRALNEQRRMAARTKG